MPRARDDRTLDLLGWQPPELVHRYDDRVVRAGSLKDRISLAVAATLKESKTSRDDIAAAGLKHGKRRRVSCECETLPLDLSKGPICWTQISSGCAWGGLTTLCGRMLTSCGNGCAASKPARRLASCASVG